MFPKFAKVMDLLGMQTFDITYFTSFTKSLIEQRKDSKEVRQLLLLKCIP